MNMKTRTFLLLPVLALGLVAVSCSQGGTKQASETESEEVKAIEIASVTIDPAQSRVVWAGTMLGVYTHEGTLDLTKAELSMADGRITGGNFTADMNSMVATDENYNPEEGSTPEKLVGHLKSADFFDVENYPEATFVITGASDNSVTGMMTIRGVTNEEKVENVMMSKEGDMVKITGDMTIDRKKYNVSWDSPVAERVLSSDLVLKIELLGK
jgi:polyisoprenoid-binding protein YceI